MLVKEREQETELVGILRVDDRLLVTDPCYERGTWCTEQVDLPYGIYNAYTTTSNRVVCSIAIVRNDFNIEDVYIDRDTVLDMCGVDSGQLGIFNDSRYNEPVEQDEYNKSLDREFPYEDWKRDYTGVDTFYRCCCNYTLSSNKVGIIDNVGLVASSGYGDGSYRPFYLVDNSGNKVGLYIKFVGDNHDEY